ncbi:hypothetical protein ACKAV7_001446 [Fusarium commune]
MGCIPTCKQPNFLVIVADDLGYSDLGCFGSEIATPNLDRLSQTGVRLTNFHTASACSPTRSMLFSGTDNHIAGLGQMTEHMARFMDKYKNRPGYEGYLNFRVAALNRKDTEQPFFAYLPFTAPPWPLQAPRETIEKYKGIYDDGPEALRKRRLANLVELGLISEDSEPAPMTVELWDKMSPTEKAESARKMEVYAAMVDLIDVNIGRVVDYLDSVDELDNTFVLFMSDNGAEGAMLEAVPMMGSVGSVSRIISKYYNNLIDNMGMADSYIWYGPEWACASMAPSRGFKTWITEGGIRCPCLVRYPPFSKAGGSHTDSFCTVMDILPTVLDLAGVPLPGSRFRGREVFPVRGSSWVSHLEDQSPAFHDEEKEITGWELFGLRAIREGHWKALYMTAPRGKDKWELYNLKNDPGELHDLADNNPDIMDRLINLWEIYYSETGMFDPGHEFGVTKI